jgi:DNA-binding MarR family transcriptional regulator
MVTSGAVTKRVDRLAAKGLVERLRSTADGRSRTVVLTPEGRRVIDAAMDEHVVNEARLLAGLEPRERAELADLLGRLASSLGV